MQITCPKCSHVHYVESRRKQRQSDMLHAIIGEWSRQMGEDFETAKIMAKFRHGVWVTWGAMTLPEWPGKPAVIYPDQQNEQWVYMKSESAYTVDEEKQLIEGVITECHEGKVDIDRILEGAEEAAYKRRRG